jgi:hypothetical protein
VLRRAIGCERHAPTVDDDAEPGLVLWGSGGGKIQVPLICIKAISNQPP